MTAWMYRLTLPDGWSDDAIHTILAAAAAGPLSAWLDDEAREDGLRLSEQIAPADAPSLIREWPRGRLFHRETELRWERRRTGLALVVTTTTSPGPAGDAVRLTESGGPHKLLLWGERRAGGWQDARISHINYAYPEDWAGPHAAVQAQSYETEMPGMGRIEPGIRVVTRYLGYDGSYTPPVEALPEEQEPSA